MVQANSIFKHARVNVIFIVRAHRKESSFMSGIVIDITIGANPNSMVGSINEWFYSAIIAAAGDALPTVCISYTKKCRSI